MSRMWNYKLRAKKFTVKCLFYGLHGYNLSCLVPVYVHFAASWILANVFSDSEHKGIIIISPWHWTQSDVLIC